MKFNKRVMSITPSETLALAAKAKAMKAAGEKVLGFAAGEPDFDTPKHIKDAAIKALLEGQTKYGPSQGLLELRKKISEKFKTDDGLTYDANQIIVSNGAKHSLFNVIMAICDESDEIIIPAPYWLSYPEMIKVAGGRSIFIPTTEATDFKITPASFEAVITTRSKAIIINSPSNPTGAVYTQKELEALAAVALKHKLYIISDEIYEKIIYDGLKHFSIGSISPEILALTVTVNGYSKAYAMPGWRLGYFGAPKEIADIVNGLQSHTTSGPNTFIQFGALNALEASQDEVIQMVKAFAERRRVMYDMLTSIKGICCAKPMGAFYMFPNISALGIKPTKFVEQLLEAAKVVAVPGESFGSEHHIRLSYACSLDVIKEGLERLARFVEKG